MKVSLRAKLIIGFCAVTIPMFILLMYNNYYAMKVVRTQVGQSNKNLLSMYMNQMDSTFEAIDNYLYTFILKDFGLGDYSDLALFSQNNSDNNEYFLAKVRLQNKLNMDLNNFKNANMFFVYSLKDHDLLSTSFLGSEIEKLQSVSKDLILYMLENEAKEFKDNRWKLIRSGGEAALIRLVRTEFDQIIGAWIDVSNLMVPLNYLNLGQQGQAIIVSNEGVPLTRVTIEAMNKPDFRMTLPNEQDLYSTLSMGTNYLLVDTKSQHGDIHLAVLIPESTLLQQLPYFQRLIFIIPLMGLVILAIYLVFLQNILLKPMKQLIKGMRRIKQGELETRLSGDKSKEFMLINETFNDMVDQIQGLKINVYEEHILTQKAELKHLQVQINPHFLLNSINIIYNLAELKKNDLIKKLSTHLADYFRFITRTNLSKVKIFQEINHIESYLEIQQLRFPLYLRYETFVEPGLEDVEILPLIIQPFVENAVIHGFQMSDEIFCIRVSITRSKEHPESLYEVEIGDNGNGIEPGKLIELQQEDLQSDYGEYHLGIWNVRHRLNLQYGEISQLRFEPGNPKGTIIRLVIPIQFGGENHV
ncbi:HAMP domain-containing protein [Paenibacillus psychroresistens]|uniref:HAMP domain-containing protein n=1 Tax=Paenibacillus psychroresistens TaxID=1778678 RepID=A0A6B8RLH0_9BACL|nr:histidine kinase [Paenibacillus psychroresistens]QGQ97160.1 HAMP domain-containing protein [Paenibacillus psychroresistens]